MAALVALLSTVGSQAQAACSCATDLVTNGSTPGNANLKGALGNNTICVAKSGGGWQNQEQHRNDGALLDYKRGTGDPIDPTVQIGTWSYTDVNVTYTYYLSAPVTYSVCSNVKKPGNMDSIGFCPSATGTSTIDATIRTGITNC